MTSNIFLKKRIKVGKQKDNSNSGWFEVCGVPLIV